MTVIICIVFGTQILNIIHHLTVIEQLKVVKRNQDDIIDCLCDIDDDLIAINDELKTITNK